jgi:hypothetical protein
MEANMNAAFSFLISAGLIAFGAWIMAGATGSSGSPLVWALIGLLPVAIGSMSLYPVIRGVKARPYLRSLP